MKYFALIFIFVSIVACKEKKVKIHFLEDILKEHNIDNSDLRFSNNIKLIDQVKVFNAIIKDSLNLINTKTINRDEFVPFETIQAIEIIRDEVIDFQFYKYYKYKAESHRTLTHIEYPLDSINRQKILIYCINEFPDENNFVSAYIKWSSKAYNQPPDYMMDKINEPYFTYLYLWDINFLTDSITTNLSLQSIKKLYPDFNGVYTFKKYNKIIIDHSYSSFDRSLFNHISFIE